MHDVTEFNTAVSSRTLPDFSFVKFRTSQNEHPGFSYISRGQSNFRSIANAILLSPTYQNNTLIIVTWDEGGGFYDHVAPPTAIGEIYPPGDPHAGYLIPYGTRVPMLAAGRFARRGYISHTQMEHSSLVRFLEFNFLGPSREGALGGRDRVVNNIGSMIDPSMAGITVP